MERWGREKGEEREGRGAARENRVPTPFVRPVGLSKGDVLGLEKCVLESLEPGPGAAEQVGSEQWRQRSADTRARRTTAQPPASRRSLWTEWDIGCAMVDTR